MDNVKKVPKNLSTKTKAFFKNLKEKKAKLTVQLTTAFISAVALAAPAFATGGTDGTGGTGGAGDTQFTAVIEFFATWIGRIGLIVGFIGAIMFALAIKNDDADAKTRGLMTLASGFVVFGVTQALDMFMI